MPSYQISLTPHRREAGRFAATVRREIQKAYAEEQAARGLTQSAIAATLGVNRSVIHRQIVGHENLTTTRVGEIASILGRHAVFMLVKPEECSNYFIPVIPGGNAAQSATLTPTSGAAVIPSIEYQSGIPQSAVVICR